jgi:ACS family sodium-dependent inorganic phosphate cotransporter
MSELYFSVNHLDLAPQHASVLMGLSNTVATLPGIISPVITGYIVQNKVSVMIDRIEPLPLV